MESVKSKPNQTPEGSIIEWLTTEAVAKHKAGEPEAAINYYLEVIDRLEEAPAWVYGNAIGLLAKLSRCEEGIVLGKQALEKHPKSSEIYRSLGLVNQQCQKLEQLIKCYRSAIKLDANQPSWVYAHLIEGLVNQNKPDEAIEYGKLIDRDDTTSHWIKYNLGNAFVMKQMWSQAKQMYVRALTIEPNFPQAIDRLNALADEGVVDRLPTNHKAKASDKVELVNSSLPQSQIDSVVSKNFKLEICEIAVGGLVKCKFTSSPTDKPLKIEVTVDRNHLTKIDLQQSVRHTAIPRNSDLADRIPQSEFSFFLPFALLDEREHKFEFTFLPTKETVEICLKTPRRSIGRLEDCEANYLRGWVLPDGHFGGSTTVDIYIDGVFFTEVTADITRKDLLKHGFGSGQSGFKVALPLPPGVDKTYQVEACFSGTRIQLKNSPLKINLANTPQPADRCLFQAKITNFGHGGLTTGWAIDHANPDKNLKLKVSIDGNAVSVVQATKKCDRTIPESLGQRPKEFSLQLPFTLLDDREHQFELIPIEESDVRSIKMNLVIPRSTVGRIDGWSDRCITGWAVPEGHFGKPTFIDVYVDGTFYQEVRADKPRKDLLKYGLGNGRNGFEVMMPLPPGDKQKYTVDIFYQGTKLRLQKSPIEISYDSSATTLLKPQGQFSVLHRTKQNVHHREVTIVIPVYNAYDELTQCLKSVFKHTSSKAKLIIINDCSPDERIPALLDWAGSYANVTVLHNNPNLGYTKTINKGIDLAARDDIVLLNSDTEVGPGWLQNLRNAVYHQADIATATAISDNSGAFSVPTVGTANDFPLWLDKEEMTRAVSQNSDAIYPETPTGSGFCIYIRREVFNAIGTFDEVAFPRGYGEENDFCMRAVRAGWRNIVDNRTLVYHVRSASFREEKTLLYDTGRDIVDERYPDYRGRVRVFVHSPQMNVMRYTIRKLIEGKWTNPIRQPRPRILFVISTQTGGTPQTNRDLMSGLQNHYHTMVLRCDAEEIVLYDTSDGKEVVCETFSLQSPITLTAHQSSEYENIVGDLLINYSIEILHVRHIAWHSLSLCRVAKQLGLAVLFSFHDFYAICPTVNLLDENRVFCKGQCTNTDADCSIPLWKKHNHVPKLKHSFINAWRQMIAGIFPHVDAFITTSASTKTLIENIYPELEQQTFEVIPHGRDFPQLIKQGNAFAVNYPMDSKPLRILFPGNIHSAKGAELIVELKALDIENRLEFHFLGTVTEALKSQGVYHGRYQRTDFTKLVGEIQPNYIGIFSIWAETYCHTLTESWASGVPVIAIDLGAVGERIEQHGGGWAISADLEPSEIYARLLQIASDTEGYMSKVSEVNRWQLSYGRQNKIATMAQKYHQLYQRVLSSSLSFPLRDSTADANLKSPIRLGVFIHHSATNQSPPSAHIRVLEWLQCHSVSQHIDFQLIDIDSFIYDRFDVFELDMVLVQRNTIKPHLVDRFINHCKKRNLPIIFEIDDDLTNVPPAKDPTGIYAKTAVGIKAIIAASSTTIVSTEPLGKKLSQYNSNIVVVPNTISESIWFRPLAAENNPSDRLFDPDKIKILYMGNPTHGEDLAMVKPVFEKLVDRGYPVQLYVIGGEPESASKDWYQRISIPAASRHYPQFVPWFRQLAENFTLAIAPLVENEFNQCKSPLKYLQYSAVGLPTICSNVTPYKELVSDHNGFLVDNTVEQWCRVIADAIDNSETLPEISHNAREFVVSQYGISNYTAMYLNIFQKLLIPGKVI